MLDLSLKNYVDWRVAQVIPVRSGFGYRVFLKYPDGSEKPQQKSGFKTEREANKAREKTIAELYNGTFVVYAKVNVADFMFFWLEEELKKRTDSHETYYNYCGIVKNHIIPILGKKKMMDVTRGDIQKLFNTKTDYSRSVVEQVKTIMNVSFRYAVTIKVIPNSPVDGIGLPKAEKLQQKSGFRTRNIDTQKTLTMEQIQVLLEKSKDTPIHMQVLLNVLMGLRRSEINGVKYSNVNYINHTLKVERQLGRIHNTVKEDFAPKTFTKQEVGLKTRSSYREIPIPDYVFEAILKERRIYEKNKNHLHSRPGVGQRENDYRNGESGHERRAHKRFARFARRTCQKNRRSQARARKTRHADRSASRHQRSGVSYQNVQKRQSDPSRRRYVRVHDRRHRRRRNAGRRIV